MNGLNESVLHCRAGMAFGYPPENSRRKNALSDCLTAGAVIQAAVNPMNQSAPVA